MNERTNAEDTPEQHKIPSPTIQTNSKANDNLPWTFSQQGVYIHQEHEDCAVKSFLSFFFFSLWNFFRALGTSWMDGHEPIHWDF